MRKGLAVSVLASSILLGSGHAFAATYQIQHGDTYWKLAQTFRVSVSSFVQANPGLDPYNLQIGQAIRLPADLSTYVVKRGDTLWSIAKSQHVNLRTLEALNPQVDPYNVYPGLVLKMPHVSEGKEAAQTDILPTSQQAVSVGGKVLQYSNKMKMIATAYTAGEDSNGGWGAVDYFGNPLKVGTVAVDPRVIPLGSRLYVTGYTFDGLPVGGMFCTATDVGGGIKGNRIDIFVPASEQQAKDFGMQNVTVYVLK
jgi:3D (Asp-Asp-Asp) domain-containing protein